MTQKGLVKIFNIEGGHLELSTECYTEPYLKAIIDRYKDPIPALCFVYYMTYPWSMYNNMLEDEKEEMIKNTYPGEYSTEHSEIINAVEELKKRFETPVKRFFDSQRNSMEVLSKYYSTLTIESVDADGMRGNLKLIKDQLKESKTTMQAYLSLETLYKEEVESRLTGNLDAAYDENFE